MALTLVPVFIDACGVLLGLRIAVGVVDFCSEGLAQSHSLDILHLSVPVLIYLVILQLSGVYQRTQSLMNIEEMRGLVKGCFLGTLVNHGFFSLFAPEAIPTRGLLLGGGLFFLLSAFLRLLFYKFEQWLHKRGWATTRVLLLGTGPTCTQLVEKMREHPKLGLLPLGVVAENQSEASQWAGLPVVGKMRDLFELLERLPVDEVLSAISPGEREVNGVTPSLELTNVCRRLRIRFRWVPSLAQTAVQRIVVEDLAGFPLVELRDLRLRPWERALKRFFDLLVACVLLVGFGWLFALLALLVRKSSAGPVLFSQERVGQDGRTFTMYKFRTMYEDVEPFQHKPTSPEDPRITTIGKFLRRSSLDELPQLWNVVRGEMSLVGPRPEMPFIADRYTDVEKERLNVKPGITGLWQISTDRGKDIHAHPEYDLYYIREWSLFLDLAILLRTVLSVVLGVGAV